MKAREAINVFERALKTGFCVSLRGFATCVGVVPSTIVNWKNNPEQELRGTEATKVQYVKELLEKHEPEFVDWSAFRREAAKDILCARISGRVGCYNADDKYVNAQKCRDAIRLADELIKQLKEK